MFIGPCLYTVKQETLADVKFRGFEKQNALADGNVCGVEGCKNYYVFIKGAFSVPLCAAKNVHLLLKCLVRYTLRIENKCLDKQYKCL